MSEIDISYEEEQMGAKVPQAKVETIIRSILTSLGKEDSDITCAFVTDAKMQELNDTYRGKKETTDILSFVQSDELDGITFPANVNEGEFLGDLVISLAAMEQNCEIFGVDFSEELTRLLVHGILHLVGWDHQTNEAHEPMLQKQEEMVSLIKKESIA